MRFKRKNLRTKGAANSLLGGGKRKGGKSLEPRDVGKSFAVGRWVNGGWKVIRTRSFA